MTVLQIVGTALAVVGVAEFFVFRYLALHQENIARRRTLLNANSALNIIVGLILVIIGS